MITLTINVYGIYDVSIHPSMGFNETFDNIIKELNSLKEKITPAICDDWKIELCFIPSLIFLGENKGLIIFESKAPAKVVTNSIASFLENPEAQEIIIKRLTWHIQEHIKIKFRKGSPVEDIET